MIVSTIWLTDLSDVWSDFYWNSSDVSVCWTLHLPYGWPLMANGLVRCFGQILVGIHLTFMLADNCAYHMADGWQIHQFMETSDGFHQKFDQNIWRICTKLIKKWDEFICFHFQIIFFITIDYRTFFLYLGMFNSISVLASKLWLPFFAHNSAKRQV